MSKLKTLSTLFLAVALTGCAAMNEQECQVTDWRAVGFEAGVAGRSVSSIANYRQACSKFGVTPDLDSYRTGHSEGVEIYCRPARGFEVGRRGSSYQGVCPVGTEPEFLAAYGEGRQLYELEYALRTVNNLIASKKKTLEQLRTDIISTAAAIIADETSVAERARLLGETAALARNQGELEEEIAELEQERVIREVELLDYQETLAFVF